MTQRLLKERVAENYEVIGLTPDQGHLYPSHGEVCGMGSEYVRYCKDNGLPCEGARRGFIDDARQYLDEVFGSQYVSSWESGFDNWPNFSEEAAEWRDPQAYKDGFEAAALVMPKKGERAMTNRILPEQAIEDYRKTGLLPDTGHNNPQSYPQGYEGARLLTCCPQGARYYVLTNDCPEDCVTPREQIAKAETITEKLKTDFGFSESYLTGFWHGFDGVTFDRVDKSLFDLDEVNLGLWDGRDCRQAVLREFTKELKTLPALEYLVEDLL